MTCVGNPGALVTGRNQCIDTCTARTAVYRGIGVTYI